MGTAAIDMDEDGRLVLVVEGKRIPWSETRPVARAASPASPAPILPPQWPTGTSKAAKEERAASYFSKGLLRAEGRKPFTPRHEQIIDLMFEEMSTVGLARRLNICRERASQLWRAASQRLVMRSIMNDVPPMGETREQARARVRARFDAAEASEAEARWAALLGL